MIVDVIFSWRSRRRIDQSDGWSGWWRFRLPVWWLGCRLRSRDACGFAFIVDVHLHYARRITEGSEIFVLRIVHENVAICQKQNPGFAVPARLVPTAGPELPAKLKRNCRLPRPCRKCQQVPWLPLQDRLDCSIDGHLLVC